MTKKNFLIKASIFDKKGRLLSVGKNSYTKTHPIQAKYAKRAKLEHKIFLHAEMDAIIRLKDPDKAYKIIIERYDSEGRPVNAKPCAICQAAIKGMTKIQVIDHT
jgi:deoxycytidylate deaminase